MQITVNQLRRGLYLISNDMNTIRLEYSRVMRYDTLDGKYHPGWGFDFNGQKYFFGDKNSAMESAFKILRNHNAFDVEGFLNHLSSKDDELDERYIQTIRNIIEYGLRHECLVENQFVDWITSIISNADVCDAVLFMNDMWLDNEYKTIKNNQYFILKEWVLSSEVWSNEVGHVDCGHKPGLFRGYRIEVADMTGTRWLPIECLGENDTLSSYFNNDEHIEFYNVNEYRPTGRIAFIGYYKLLDDEYERID